MVIQTVTVFQLVVVKKQCVSQDHKLLMNYQSSKGNSHTPAYLILSLTEFDTITLRYLLSLFFLSELLILKMYWEQLNEIKQKISRWDVKQTAYAYTSRSPSRPKMAELQDGVAW